MVLVMILGIYSGKLPLNWIIDFPGETFPETGIPTQVRMGLGLNDDINEYLQANITQCYKQIQNLTRYVEGILNGLLECHRKIDVFDPIKIFWREATLLLYVYIHITLPSRSI